MLDWIDDNISDAEFIMGLAIAHLSALALALWLEVRAMRRAEQWRRNRGRI